MAEEDATEDHPLARDPLVQRLKDPDQRATVVAFAKALSAEAQSENEDSQGLYDRVPVLLRYLRARQWDVARAVAMLRNTARWRKEFGWRKVFGDEWMAQLSAENSSGKMYVRGFDKRKRPCIIVKPRNEFSTDDLGVLRHTVYVMERACAVLDHQIAEGAISDDPNDANAAKFVLLVDFGGYSSFRNNMPMSTVQDVLSIMQNHYPERLANAFIINSPWWLSGLYAVIKVFMDPVTLEKFQVTTEEGEALTARLEPYVDASALEQDCGGEISTPFDSHCFLTVKAKGKPSVFGSEFNEQDRMSGASSVGTRGVAGNSATSRAFWATCSDGRVLSLQREERALVRKLASELQGSIDEQCDEHHGLFDDAGMLIRYLRASKWNFEEAMSRLRATARWRKGFDFRRQREGQFSEILAQQNALGRLYVRGYDRRARPIIYCKLCHRDTFAEGDCVRHVVYCMERACACLDQHDAFAQMHRPDSQAVADAALAAGKVTILVDFTGYSRHNRPALQTIKAILKILQDHYPERLGEAYLMHPPLKVSTLWKALKHLVDAETYSKVVLVNSAQRQAELLETVFDRSTLERSVGGENDAAFDSNIYMTTHINGNIYGFEFDAQLAASRDEQPPRVWRLPVVPACAEVEQSDEKADDAGWWFSFDGLFGSSTALW